MFDLAVDGGQTRHRGTNLRDLVDRCRKVARDDLSSAGDDELRALALEVEQARAALDAVEGHALALLDRRGSCDADLGMSTPAWLAWATHRSRRTSSARVRAGWAMCDLPDTDLALSDGELGFEHAEVLAHGLRNPRVADQLIVNEGELVALAKRVPFEVWRRTVAELVQLWDQDGAFDPDRELARNRLSIRQAGDTVVLRGELVGETAVVVRQAIEAMADRLWRRAQRDREQADDLPVPSEATRRALALAELCREGTAESATSAGPVADVTLIFRADAPDAIRTPDGERLEPRGLGHLLCDAARHLLLVDEHDVPLHLGRTVRHANRAQRRALAARDGGCVFPGCDRPVSRCDAHHIPAFHPAGATDIDKMALLCRHHHGVTHRRGWSMVAEADQTFSWTTPSGRTLRSRRQHGPP
jgi:hypothetical protein